MDIPAKAEKCKRDSCQEGKCSLDVSGLGKQIDIVDLNCIRSVYHLKGSISDFGIVWKNKNIVAVAELKGGDAGQPLKKLVAQLQKGLDALDSVLERQPVRGFYPLLLYRPRIHQWRLCVEQGSYFKVWSEVLSRNPVVLG